MLVPIRTRTDGPSTVAIRAVSVTTMASVPASEASRAPGTTKRATTIERTRVLPAKTTVRAAVRRVVQAAVTGSAPSASSSRKRETISSA